MQHYIFIREQARVWNLAPTCFGLPTEIMLSIASFAPLAGARMLCTGRNSYAMCDSFLRSVQTERGLRGNYLSAMRRFLCDCRCRGNRVLRRQIQQLVISKYSLDLEMQIAAVAEFGGDADLVFSLALILEDEVAGYEGHHVSRYWSALDSYRWVCHDGLGPPLYAACGPTGSDAVVSLLIRLGAPAGDRRVFVSGKGDSVYLEESALCRAVRLQKQSTVCILLRASALTACQGMDRRYRCLDIGSGGWQSALYVAAVGYVGYHGGIVKALLEARACPSRANCCHWDRVCVDYARRARFFLDRHVSVEYTCFDHARGALVLDAFLTCERRCCCSSCMSIFGYRDYR